MTTRIAGTRRSPCAPSAKHARVELTDGKARLTRTRPPISVPAPALTAGMSKLTPPHLEDGSFISGDLPRRREQSRRVLCSNDWRPSQRP